MMLIEYQSQRVSLWYFRLALVLFILQVIMGLWLSINYAFTLPQELVNVFPFSTAREIHTNVLVAWMLLGFMGGTYYILPPECGRELYSPKIAYAQLIIFVAAAVTAVVGFLFGWTRGKPLLEIPFPLNALIVVAALLFIANVAMTIIESKEKSALQWMLLGGVTFLAVMYLFGMPFYKNLNTDYYYWWWVIHLWVEGAWEVVTASIVAYIIMRVTGVDRKVVEKWLYVETGLFLFTGIVGTGHHYYWIGAPDYWIWWGGIFSALEPLPIVLMVVDTWMHVRERKNPIVNPLTWYYIIGLAIYHLVGAGLWGFMHTLPPINYYTHGSQVTVSHGHLAFFGAYALLNLTIFYFAMPRLKGINKYQDRLGKWGFWITTIGMFILGLVFGIAGILQTYLERFLDIGYSTAHLTMMFWFRVAFGVGLVFLAGVIITVYHLFTIKPSSIPPPEPVVTPAANI
ncbi:cbb3-type cytochrome c oxidase subunit I [Geomonas oryzisoli]|uniref:Cbb3-type cytochrome c oxidase subunit I n=1 Tax=Geomonas oryzisoli TaxID=2847992 RepID=A0ABX8J1V0_9BACT|nr:cbb3-type cytochrome c oxidase subunit I [Geomonas oryzisoli]QWV92284.1 cbb3-type cytochrome c oxidase subunit I [Geomonas oryzisoli]